MENEILEYELYRLEVIKSRLISIIGRLIATIILVVVCEVFDAFKAEKVSMMIVFFYFII